MTGPVEKRESPPKGFREVLSQELLDIEDRRIRLGQSVDRREDTGDKTASLTGKKVEARAHYRQLRGLAFSGGGIRSATFNLGVLQALAKLGLLSWFDYLSTVSGGGYIGSWLAAQIHHGSLEKVEKALVREHPEIKKDASPPPDERYHSPISFLRQFSNYLTPRGGFLSLDTWTVIATYGRNLALNLTTVILAISLVLLGPRAVLFLGLLVGHNGWTLVITIGIVVLSMFASLLVIAYNLGRRDETNVFGRPPGILWGAVVPFFLAGALTAFLLHDAQWLLGDNPVFWTASAGALYLLFWVGAALATRLMPHRKAAEEEDGPPKGTSRAKSWGLILFWALFAGAGGGRVLWAVVNRTRVSVSFDPLVDLIPVATFGPPVVVMIFVLTAVIHIGLIGRVFEERSRQWWSRLGAWLLILSLGWMSLFVLAFYAPKWLLALRGVSSSLILGWALATAFGIWLGRSSKTGDGARRWRELIAGIAPYFFVVGLVALLALAVQFVVPLVPMAPVVGAFGPPVRPEPVTRHLLIFAITFVSLLGALLALSWRVDINLFSMHLFYRNRLIRAYLGTSRRRWDTSKRDPFTGFDPDDDLALADLRVDDNNRNVDPPYKGPYPILTATLSLASVGELAQERRASAFVFTPRFYGFVPAPRRARSGYESLQKGYRETALANDGRGVTLGTAMGISGAAVSPNMGHHRSPPLAFLLTVFNARLGWWMGNPKHAKTWSHSGPRFGLGALLGELLGRTHADAAYVHLSDGGFFDNLGLYELVRRRSRFIVVCDAEADPDFEFNGLGTAIRRCRSDFGIGIDIDVDPIRKQAETGYSRWHCAVGKIHYGQVDEKAPQGTLVYIKASLTGDEPEDLLNYSRQNPDFPHESTADQFFGEAQFESYRMLGYHAALKVFEAAGIERRKKVNMESVFVRLRRVWYPPSEAGEATFTRHAEALDEIFERIRGDENLAFLDQQIYRELDEKWADLDSSIDLWEERSRRLGPEEFRAGFYLCNSVIQLMESVYLDLDLETEDRHPDNRGWMNLFRQWSVSPIFRQTWAVSSSTRGLRFQSFCERRLGLDRSLLIDHLDRTPEIAARASRDADPGSVLDAQEQEVLAKLLGDVDLKEGVSRLLALRVLVPASAASKAGSLLEFTFGMVILDKKCRIFYLWVREHLRRRGLARRALRHLMDPEGELKVEGRMLPNGEQLKRVGLEGSRRVFDNLFRSVRNEIQLEKLT